MKKSSKSTSKNEVVFSKEKIIEVLKEIFANIKKYLIIFGKEIKKFSKKDFGKFNGTHVLVCGALLVLLFIFVGRGFFTGNDVEYPIVYNNTDGDMFLLDSKGKSHSNALKLANGESVSNVTYANTTNRYVLFEKNESLYLYDSKEKDETTQIVSNVSDYWFTEDDKYIVVVDETKNLHIYNYKDTKKVDTEIDTVLDVRGNKILYEKDNTLYARDVNPKKDDKLKVSEDYETLVRFSEDGKNILYINGERELYFYNIKKDESKRIAKNVTTYYCDKESCESLFYVETDSSKIVYYYDGESSTKIVKDLYSVYAYNTEKQQIIYTVLDNGEYTLYYKQGENDAVQIESRLHSIRTVKIFEGKEIYYITGDNEVKYAKIRGEKLDNVKTIGNDVTGFLYPHKEGYAFVGNVKDSNSGKLYVAKKGTAKEIDEKVNANFIVVSKSGKRIYYMKEYEKTGDLYYTTGSKGKLVEKDVYDFEYFKDDLIYLIKDYSSSKSKGTLYRYTNKTVKVADDVTRIAPSPVTYEAK